MNPEVICAEGPYEGETWGDVKNIVVKEKGEAEWMSWPQSVRWRARTENDDLKEENKRLKDEKAFMERRLREAERRLVHALGAGQRCESLKEENKSLKAEIRRLNGEHKYPKTIDEYKGLFKKLGIGSDDLKGKRAFKLKYDGYLKKKEEETEELDEDTSDFDEFQFEGVDYLEDNDSEKIYNTKHTFVGAWNADCDDIIWESDEFREQHETLRP